MSLNVDIEASWFPRSSDGRAAHGFVTAVAARVSRSYDVAITVQPRDRIALWFAAIALEVMRTEGPTELCRCWTFERDFVISHRGADSCAGCAQRDRERHLRRRSICRSPTM
jgi:hypothetical protein